MPFNGGGGGALPAHVHNSVPLQGGPLDFANDTIASLNVGSTTFSDGAALQELVIGTPAQSLVVNGAGNAPEWASVASGLWIPNGTATASTLQSELAVTGISNTPDIVQILFNIAGDNATNGHLAFRVNNVQTATYQSRVMGFYTSFDYDAFTTKNEFWIDRDTNTMNRCGEILLFKGNSHFNNGTQYGNVGACFRAMLQESLGGATGNSSYVTMSGGANESISGDITSIQMLFDSGDIMGNIQVNSMTYQ